MIEDGNVDGEGRPHGWLRSAMMMVEEFRVDGGGRPY